MKKLVLDYGNSLVKVGIFDGPELVEKFVFPERDALLSFLSKHEFSHAIISSVNAEARELAADIRTKNRVLILDSSLPLPFTNRYATPKTLGVDRIAGVCGAIQLFPGQPSLVIDAGTCITCDFVDGDGVYHGGGISPGLRMRFKAVHTFTARLPLVHPMEVELIGNSTETCIQSGIVHGTTAELEGIIGRYQALFPDVRVILCGGDTAFFENRLKASIFASPELVLVGLNCILSYNVAH